MATNENLSMLIKCFNQKSADLAKSRSQMNSILLDIEHTINALMFQLVLVVALSTWSIAGLSANIYVAKTGNNSNTGTFNSPFLTIQKGLDVAKAGDTVLIQGGIYQEYVLFPKSGIKGKPIILKNFKQETVTVDAQNTRTYCINGDSKEYIGINGINAINANNYGIRFANCSNITIDNCRVSSQAKSKSVEAILITNSIRRSNYTIKNCYTNNASDGICIWGEVTNVLIQNCETENSYYCGISVHAIPDDSIVSPHQIIIDRVYSHNNGWAGIGVRNTVNITIRKSHIAYNGSTGIQLERNSYNSLIEDNVSEYNSRSHNFETGIWIYNSANSIVRRNIMRGNQTGLRVWSMKNFQAYYNLIINNNFRPNETTENTSGADFRESTGKFQNNVLYGNSASNSKLGSLHVFPQGKCNISFNNNIIMNDGSTKDVVLNQSDGSNVFCDFNLIFNDKRPVKVKIKENIYGWIAYKAKSNQDVHSINVDPKFMSSVKGDFKLQLSSPAINAGVEVGLTHDYIGNQIVGLPDIGAFEY